MTIALGLSEHLVNSTVRIACSKKDGGISIGTGCLVNFRRPGIEFVPTLVTNRHVIENCTSGTFFLTEIDAEGNPQFGVSHSCALPDFETNWIAHPDPSVDLCAMPLGGLVGSSDRMGQSFRGFEGHMLASRERLQQLAALDRVITIGYPVGLWDEVNNMPVFRTALAATHPYIDHQGRKEFLIDMACFPGSSGSPVVLATSSPYIDKLGINRMGTEVALLGILSCGPQYTVDGDIVIVPAPTDPKPITASRIPTNLGCVIKAERLREFEPRFKHLCASAETITIQFDAEYHISPPHPSDSSNTSQPNDAGPIRLIARE